MDPHLSTLYAFEEGRSFASVLGAPPPRLSPPNRRSPPSDQISTNSNSPHVSTSPQNSSFLHPDSSSAQGANRLSPLSIPLASSPSGSPPNGAAKSPQMPPPAPQRTTIPLPLDTEGAQYQYQQYQTRSGLGTPGSHPALSREATIIDLTKLAGPPLPKTTITPPIIDISNPASMESLARTSRNSSTDHFHMDDRAEALDMQGQKTPNVYINGLPPHFPEDQLFALAAPFGEIRSVRTFTRHVRDSESGYGFVLFETIDAAEQCINSLRRYRNLHPTFSKQIHKIPGTQYASIPSSNSSWSRQGSNSSDAALDPNTSFKAKMESLHDPTSTNLYMEGLPLSLNDNALAKLVAPHRIISSRVFQTRLSTPARMIAFVRLDTRRGAEEIIERLHGRMVRGVDDPGCRISVRFADTSEQRELRRQERVVQEDDSSPARLTMAQASLLNLHGPAIGVNSRAVTKLPSSTSTSSLPPSASVTDFASNIAHNLRNVPVIGTQRNANTLNVDYSLAPPRSSFSGHSSRERSPVGMPPYQLQPDLYGLGHSPSPMDPTMLALLGSLGPDENGNYGGMEYGQHFGMGINPLVAAQGLGGYVRTPPVSTRTGYTPAEEYIMRAHAESAALAQAQAQAQAQVLQLQQQQHVQSAVAAAAAAERRRPAPLDLRRGRMEGGYHGEDTSVGVGMRGYRAQASLVGRGVISPPATTGASGSFGMGMSDEDYIRSQLMAMGLDDNEDAGRGLNASRHAPRNLMSARSAGDDSQQGQRSGGGSAISPRLLQNDPAGVDGNAGQQQQQQQHGAHMRSTTLPPRSAPGYRHASGNGQASGAGQHKGHFTHSSMSIPAPSMRTPQHASVGAMSGHGMESKEGVIYEGDQQQMDEQMMQGPKTAALGSGIGMATSMGLGDGARNPPASAPAAKSTYSPGLFGEIGSGSSGVANNSSTSPTTSLSAHATTQNTSDVNANVTSNALGVTYHGHPSNSTSTTSSISAGAPSTTGSSTNTSPTMISPTLTYSSQTPSTLSPATPFFGSFNNGVDGFASGDSKGSQGGGDGASAKSQQQQQGGQAQEQAGQGLLRAQ